MQNLIEEFQYYLNEKKIEMANPSFNRTLYQIRFYLISTENNQQNDINILNYITENKIIIIDKIEHSNDQYFIICFDLIILIIKHNELSLVQSFFSNNIDSTMYFIHNSKDSFDSFIKYNNSFQIETSFSNDINNFKEQFIPKKSNKINLTFWKMIKLPIIIYLITKSYKNYCQNRLKEILPEINNNDRKKSKFEINEFIHFRNLETFNNVGFWYHIESEQLYVLKTAEKNLINAKKFYKREMINYLNISHPFIPQFYGTLEKNGITFLVIEYIQGKTLYELNKQELNDKEKIKILFELMIVIEYLHNKNYIYRDLKPNNIIIDLNGTVVLIDFDKMISINDIEDEMTCDFPPNFSAPELSQGQAFYSSDIYSIGKIIYYIFTGKVLKINEKIDLPQKYSNLKNLIEKCIDLNPLKRPKISELIDTIYIEYYSDIHIHGLNINENESYLQQFSEINTIKTIKNIHSNEFIEYWTYIAEFDKKYSQKNLSLIYSENKIFPKNLFKYHHYRFLSKNNNNHIQFIQCILGNIYFEGKEVKQDINKAIYFYTLSANKNYFLAQFSLGNIYSDDKYDKKDIQKAIYYYSLLPEIHYEAQLKLGLIYYNIHEFKKAIYHLNIAAHVDNTEALFYLGEIYGSEQNEEYDELKAFVLYQNAANQNHPIAQYKLSLMFLKFNRVDKFLYYIELSVKNGYSEAQYFFANYYESQNSHAFNINKAIYYYSLASNQNHPKAQFKLGYIYYQGNLIDQNIDKAIYYFTLASNNNHPLAQGFLGEVYSKREYNKYDIKKSIHFYKLAAEQSVAFAANNLGSIYQLGIVVERDLDKACYYYTIAANQNITFSLYNLGKLYEDPFFHNKNINLALKYFEIAANQNFAPAQYELGILYYKINNFNKSLNYILLAAHQNEPRALTFLGALYENGEIVSRNINKAISYYKLASDRNNYYAQNNLGLIYYIGKGIPRDINEAIYYFTKASDLNYSEGQYNLANVYLENRSIKVDFKIIIHLLSLAASQNHLQALYTLGLTYLRGDDVPQDIDKSIFYFTKASDLGDNVAQNNLGSIYYLYKKNYHKAFHYIQLAAKNNNSISQHALAYFHLLGEHVEYNVNKGIKYLNLSAENGNNMAIFKLGLFYHIGKFVKKDSNKALHYYKLLTSLKDQYSKNNIALIYKNGDGVQKNIANAFIYLEEAIKEKNDVLALINLAKIHLTEKDYFDINKSIYLLSKASKLDMEHSPVLLGFVLVKKLGFSITLDIIENELKKYDDYPKELAQKVFKMLIKYQLNKISLYNEFDQLYKKFDYIYNEFYEIRSFDNEKYKIYNLNLTNEEKAKNINTDFYEGFGFD